jgi:hypothetical protein
MEHNDIPELCSTANLVTLSVMVGDYDKGRGPLSPMLFIIAMDPLQQLLHLATQEGLLNPIGAAMVKLGTSLYADDAALFIRPVATDLANPQQLLQLFGQATGICTNIQKSEIIPIRYEGIDIPDILGELQGRVTDMTCRYLGLTLRTGRTTREDEQRLID